MSVGRVLVIAEAGVNHNGDLDLARRLVERAAEAGADLVKFQTFRRRPAGDPGSAQSRLSDSRRRMRGVTARDDPSARAFDGRASGCSSPTAGGTSVGFFSTGFDEDSVDLLAELGLARFKIPSGEITNLPYLRHVGRLGKPIILSTGMARLDEIEAALEALETAGTPRSLITVLHCKTEYPTPMTDVNLRAMQTIRDTFGVQVGYSDHTVGIEVAVAAVALGATVIEKHFTLDRNLPGPDHRASLEPDEFKAMVRAIRNIEQALGDGVKRPSPSESKNLPIARKSLVATRFIRAGEAFTAANLAAKRPGDGISPMRWDEVMGQVARRDFAPDELIEL